MNIKRIKCILTGGCRFRDSAISECDDKEKTCTITETCCKCGKKYTAVFTYKQLGMWKQFAAEAEALRSRYVGAPEEHFVGKLILAVTNEVENVSKTLE